MKKTVSTVLGLGSIVAGAFLAIGCGADESLSRPEPTGASADSARSMQLEGATDPYCPSGATFDAGSKLCVKDGNAVGPFTVAMRQKCTQVGGGQACSAASWTLAFAKSVRGTGACPIGATASAKGVCIEGETAFGPFTTQHVENCTKSGGGISCTDSLEWFGSFAESTAPSVPVKLPWKWILPVDNGLRSDSCGAGEFRASRGGGKRVHKGIDILGRRGTAMFAPCQGSVEVGYDKSGYGNYVVVVCEVPDVITGGDGTFVSMLYGHLDVVSVRGGQAVSPGQRLGTLGKSGNADSGCIAPHVHFEAIVENSFTAAFNATPRSMIESESAKEDEYGVMGSVGSLASQLASRCMNPLGFKTVKGLTYNSNVDPFVLLSCLVGNKPGLSRANLGSSWVPWSSFYSATGFDVNVGRR